MYSCKSTQPDNTLLSLDYYCVSHFNRCRTHCCFAPYVPTKTLYARSMSVSHWHVKRQFGLRLVYLYLSMREALLLFSKTSSLRDRTYLKTRQILWNDRDLQYLHLKHLSSLGLEIIDK